MEKSNDLKQGVAGATTKQIQVMSIEEDVRKEERELVLDPRLIELNVFKSLLSSRSLLIALQIDKKQHGIPSVFKKKKNQ